MKGFRIMPRSIVTTKHSTLSSPLTSSNGFSARSQYDMQAMSTSVNTAGYASPSTSVRGGDPVESIMPTDFAKVTSTDTVARAVDEMRRFNKGAVCVFDVSGTQLTGIFTERDVLRVFDDGKSALTTAIETVMTPASKLVTGRPEDTTNNCRMKMVENRIRHLPILGKDGQVISMVSMTDIINALNNADLSSNLFGVNLAEVEEQAKDLANRMALEGGEESNKQVQTNTHTHTLSIFRHTPSIYRHPLSIYRHTISIYPLTWILIMYSDNQYFSLSIASATQPHLSQDILRTAFVVAGAVVGAALLQRDWVHDNEWLAMSGIFLLGYVGIIFESFFEFNKAAIGLLMATALWVVYAGQAGTTGNSPLTFAFVLYHRLFSLLVYFTALITTCPSIEFIFIHPYIHSYNSIPLEHNKHNIAGVPIESALSVLSEKVGEVSEVVFFLMGAMTIVEIVDSHRGFKVVTDAINSKDKRSLMWVVGVITFFMSAILDNLTTTIVMVSLAKKLLPDLNDRKLFGAMIVIAGTFTLNHFQSLSNTFSMTPTHLLLLYPYPFPFSPTPLITSFPLLPFFPAFSQCGRCMDGHRRCHHDHVMDQRTDLRHTDYPQPLLAFLCLDCGVHRRVAESITGRCHGDPPSCFQIYIPSNIHPYHK